MNSKEIQHLYWRAGFGITPDKLDQIKKSSRKEIVGDLFTESKYPKPLSIDTSEFNNINPLTILKDKKKLRAFIKRSQELSIEYNYAWIKRIANSEDLLRERMTLFWANHFVCKDHNIFYVQQYNNTLRKYALGDLIEFTKAVSKQPAMLKYLNNKQNVKSNPNENFARELMELFTLGKGNYSEKDIKESARAFTGYFHNFKGEFMVRRLQHDYGLKRFLGKRGRFNGDDIIDIIFSKRECAHYICEKIYSYFVNDKINQSHISEMVKVLYPKYNIGQLMRYVFMSEWFYNSENIGSKIKSPIDFLVGIHKTVPLNFRVQKQILALQRVLGQVLLDPPNVAGWTGGRTWIDSNTILLRLRLPSLLLSNGLISTKKKGEFNDQLAKFIDKNNGRNRFFKVDCDWKHFERQYQNVSVEKMIDHLIVSPLNSGTKTVLNNLGKASKMEYCIQLMSIPEYQMC